MNLGSKLVAEFIGTFWLVLGGCGAAAFAAVLSTSVDGGGAFNIGLGYLGVRPYLRVPSQSGSIYRPVRRRSLP